ncbi:MAG TPA: replication-associated recombination protein A [Candidatus Anaerobutyricum stercoripullorum]|uniref:Replication-associated recombination protein A n=1 Tax=Candidatus Anaerobutyricum stercoripullorum TaxID=2838456 RepID=A0A9D1X5W7_9FIRM|nr:replication-associated recombination protein A [Candidatus Anaerobutyricum stercoripullorum]
MDLFDYMRMERKKQESPLAVRMRPRTLDEVVGQSHIIGKDRLLYRAIKADKISSLIFYGPPGTGKTTLARVIANTTSAQFVQMNATTSGKKDMEQAVSQAKDMLGMYGKRTILFIDEIHRFNKAQQDYLLPFVEDGTVILIGATTENPYFEVNGALLSRSKIFHLEPLSAEEIAGLIRKAVTDEERGMGAYGAAITEEAVSFIARMAGGDARAALNAVELGVITTEPNADGKILIDLDVAQECIQRKAVHYDKSGDNHYDVISAFIKSMRGTDPDAAVFYLARMLDAGEDPKFIARRIMICASEDVGNADPQALQVAVAASLAVERVGLPEGRIILSQAASYVASAPKSNACVMAIDKAQEMVRRADTGQVPPHLRDAHYGGARDLGHGIGYKYAHDYPENYVRQQYLPDAIREERFYIPTENGYEKQIRNHLEHLRNREEQEEKQDETI